MDEREVREVLMEMLLNDDEDWFPGGSGVLGVESFSDAGLMTSNEGLVLKLVDGREFQLQIVRSK